MALEFNIGTKIKALRKARKLTLQDVARETGFSPALISQIENNNVSPPIATLSKIARFFDVKMGHFFEDDEEDRKYEVVRRGERRVISRVISKAGTGHGYTYEALSFHKQNKKMEPFVLTVSERAEEETLYNHEGEEFLLILRGTAEVILEDQRFILEEGDAIYFDSDLRHRLLSLDGQEVEVLAVVTR
ncbi:MAG: helix-turn-helix domain-containing protein [Desulfuromonadales bacterium]|uniref:helix-turn-helix domain-containing protein n=1 Tax=Desulfuromonas sp. KJ2020 TaxID=2919173 RepID=UPI000325F5B9|nr:XRE family transcriptional regulator [Desulfuromonas sp. KJ2020]MCP3176086.1 XRE family transcriptional regulator [Desulfuromonas sp. KJ2020]MDW7644062.1 XRE family transcriptional regulator [Desulfuromonadales bacterium]MDW7758011.1 XRE family transcriptional regulator [Desulfuromonadales bacterium]